MHDLHRQYPLWPSTFSTCDCGKNLGRGGGRCADCIEEELAKLIGKPLAWEIHSTIKELTRLKSEAILGEQL